MSRTICFLLALSGAACFQLPPRTTAPSLAPRMNRPRPSIYAAQDDYDDEMRERMRVRARPAPLPVKPLPRPPRWRADARSPIRQRVGSDENFGQYRRTENKIYLVCAKRDPAAALPRHESAERAHVSRHRWAASSRCSRRSCWACGPTMKARAPHTGY